MPTNPTVEEVRELLEELPESWDAHKGYCLSQAAARTVDTLCRHFLASQQPMTAGEFAGLVVEAIDVDLIEKEKLDKKREPTVEGRDECEHFLQAFQMARAVIRRTASEHNITIVETKK